MLSPSGVRSNKTSDESANLLNSVLEAIRKDGWLESVLRNRSVCMIGDTAAVYTIKYDRIYSDGRKISGSSVYTLMKGDEWRVVAVTVTSTNLGMECSE